MDNDYECEDYDADKISQMKPTDCPRRYCGWWKYNQNFSWDTPAEQGCNYMKRSHIAKKIDFIQTPCCRIDPTSNDDHYFPCRGDKKRLIKDGFDINYFGEGENEQVKIRSEKKFGRKNEHGEFVPLPPEDNQT